MPKQYLSAASQETSALQEPVEETHDAQPASQENVEETATAAATMKPEADRSTSTRARHTGSNGRTRSASRKTTGQAEPLTPQSSPSSSNGESSPTTKPRKKRSASRPSSRQAHVDQEDSQESAETTEQAQPKKPSRAKKSTRSRQRAKPRSTQVNNPSSATVTEAVPQVQDEPTFEPDLDVTPIKPRNPTEERRESLFSDVLFDTSELDGEIEPHASPFAMEETLKRPAASRPPTIASDILIEVREEHLSLPEMIDTPVPVLDEPEEVIEIPEETPVLPLDEIFIPETPQPVFEWEDRPEAAEKEFEQASNVAVLEKQDELSGLDKQVELGVQVELDGLRELEVLEELEELEELESLEELEALDVSPIARPPLSKVEVLLPETFETFETIIEHSEVTAQNVQVITAVQVEPETPLPVIKWEPEPAPAPQPRRTVWRLTRGKAAALLLLVLALCVIPLWRDTHDAHLYLYAINPLDGQMQGQQDLGGGYANVSALSNPAQFSSSLLIGLGSQQADQQRVLALSGSGSNWSVSRAINTPTLHATLSVTPTHSLVVAYARGLQVLNVDGSLLWQTSEDAPALGAHAFAPAFDATTLYTVNSAQNGVIVAYDLRDGSLRWTQRLDDTLNYAPPFILYGDMLFVAGDHTLYALNRASGQVVWKTSAPTRTMLITQAGLLVSVGASGIQAFQPQNGQIAWSFNGHVSSDTSAGESLTNAQFYEASLSNANQVMYATGIVWDTGRVREQVWLFAIDVSTGALRWSERTGVGLTSADAGRVLIPYVDDAHGQVLLEQAHANGSHTLTAYASSDGRTRWSIQLAGVSAFAPMLFPSSNGNVSILSVQQDVGTALHSWSWPRVLLFLLSGVCILLLLLLWILPLNLWGRRTNAALKQTAQVARLPFALLKRQPARIAYSLVTLLLIAGILFVTWITRLQPGIAQIQGSNGQVQWQKSLDTPATPLGADRLGSFVVQHTSTSLSTLSALNADGSTRWSTFASEGQFSLPDVSVEPGTVLVALSGHTQPRYTAAPDDIAYPRPLDSLYTLFLYDRLTGQIVWQHTVIPGGAQQQSIVLGADAQYIYVASRISPQETAIQQDAAVQLIALDKATGNITWRVYGPRENRTAQPDFGALLSQGRLLYWQAGDTVLAIDTQLGQIEWRRYIAEQNPAGSANEESQMAQNDSVLLVTRSDQFHALDLITGSERWTVASPGSNTPQVAGGVVAVGREFILYGNGAIEAIDAASHSVIWQHTDLLRVSNVMASPDGSLIYAIVLDNIDGGTPRQSLVAFDAGDSAVRWTFQPSSQADFTWAGAPPLRFAHGLLFVTTCASSSASACSSQALYGINGASGSISWEFDASQVSQVQISQDGSAIVLQESRSAWENFRAHFQG